MTTSKASKGVDEVTTINEHNGGRCLNELAIIADDIDKMIAAPANRPADKSQSATVPVAQRGLPAAKPELSAQDDPYRKAYNDGWNDCRDNMLAASPAPAAVPECIWPDCGHDTNCSGGSEYSKCGNWIGCPTKGLLADPLRDAAKDFYNATAADPNVIIRCKSAESKSRVTQLAGRLRAALIAAAPASEVSP